MRTIQIDARNASLHGYAQNMRQAVKQPQTQTASLNKVRQMTASGVRKPLYECLREALTGAFAGSSQIFAAYVPTNTNPMCKNYGHNIDKNSWKRGLPTCQDCGATVSDASQLRKAVSR